MLACGCGLCLSSQGFDSQFDRILEENKLLKRKLVGFGDKTYAADVTQQHGSYAKDD